MEYVQIYHLPIARNGSNLSKVKPSVFHLVQKHVERFDPHDSRDSNCPLVRMDMNTIRCSENKGKGTKKTLICPHIHAYIGAAIKKTCLRTSAFSEDSDQPAHSRSLIRIFTGRILDSQGCKVSPCEQQKL